MQQHVSYPDFGGEREHVYEHVWKFIPQLKTSVARLCSANKLTVVTYPTSFEYFLRNLF